MTTTHNPQPTTVSRSSVRAWLSTRRPEPPQALLNQLLEIVDSAPDSAFAGRTVAEVAGNLGVWMLGTAVARAKAVYDTALDLLAADAFVTYAFEAASEEGEDVTGLARQLLGAVGA